MSRIFVLHDSGDLVPVEEKQYDTELLLQQLLARYPDLLAGDQIGEAEPRRWILISREMRVSDEDGANRWSLDHLFLDQDGVPTLVEVKRSTDSRIRREVVGQMLDYAANAVLHWSIDVVRGKFEDACGKDNRDPEDVLTELLGPGRDLESYWEQVQANLGAGRIRLVFVADVIPPELRRVIEFLFTQMSPAEVIGVEIRQYVGEGLKTLVPRVVGRTESARKTGSERTQRQSISEEEFWQILRTELSPEECEVAGKIIDWSREQGMEDSYKRGPRGGVFIPTLRLPGRSFYPIAIRSQGELALQMRWLKNHPPYDSELVREQLAEHLSPLGLKQGTQGMVGIPTISLKALTREEAWQHCRQTLTDILNQLRRSASL